MNYNLISKSLCNHSLHLSHRIFFFTYKSSISPEASRSYSVFEINHAFMMKMMVREFYLFLQIQSVRNRAFFGKKIFLSEFDATLRTNAFQTKTDKKMLFSGGQVRVILQFFFFEIKPKFIFLRKNFFWKKIDFLFRFEKKICCQSVHQIWTIILCVRSWYYAKNFRLSQNLTNFLFSASFGTAKKQQKLL